jgi:short-subunit dehydrogenase
MSDQTMSNPPRKIMLITGASGGIGADLARLAASKGHDLALVARNQAALDALADDIAAKGGARPLVLPCDLARPGAVDALAASLASARAEPDIVVNNAGYGILGPATDGDPAEQLGIIDLNVRALTEISLRFIEPLARSGGRILNVASTAAFLPGPGMAVYYASKAYVLSFSLALSSELAPRGISVTTLCPGPVPTGFQARARFSPNMLLLKLGSMSSQAVAEAAYGGLMARRRTVVPGLVSKLTALTAPLTPNAISLPFVHALQMSRKGN